MNLFEGVFWSAHVGSLGSTAWAWLQALHWQRPWGGLLALWPLWVWGVGRWRARCLAAYAAPHLHPWAVRAQAVRGAVRWRCGLDAFGWLALAVALAGPVSRDTTLADATRATPPSRQGLHLHVVVQVSESMREADVTPTRLDTAQLLLRQHLPQLRGESLSLIGYGADAAWLLPPTHDLGLFREALPWLDSGLVATQGNDLEAALRLVLSRHPAQASQRHAVLLLTDGSLENLRPPGGRRLDGVLRELQRRDIPVFIWLIEPHTRQPRRYAWGGNARDAAPFTTLARSAHGAFAVLQAADAGTPLDDGWATLYDAGLARLDIAQTGDAPPQQETPWHAWPLALGAAALLLAWSTWSRRLALWLLAVVLTLAQGLARAQASPGAATVPAAAVATKDTAQDMTAAIEAQAWRALQGQQWVQAMLLYERVGGFRGHWGAGYAALQGGRLDEARQNFELAWMLASGATQRADALYNLGLVLAAQQRWDAAAQTWQAVLAHRPKDSAAQHNLDVALKELRRRGQGGGVQDLYGRRGFAAQGHVLTEGGGDVREPAEGPGVPGAPGDAVTAARPAGAAGAASDGPAFELTDAHRRSARVKVERLTEQAQALRKGLVQRQDVPLVEPRLPEEGKKP